MSKKHTSIPLHNIVVADINTEGKAIARHEGLVLFIEGVVPGDVVDVTIFKQKKNYALARVDRMVSPSPRRTTPACSHFGTCGGCKWQNLAYASQLEFKQKYVRDALVRMGKLPVENFLPILGNTDSYYYRNKLEFSFSNKKWRTAEEMQQEQVPGNSNALGFHIPGMFDKVLNIEHCYLQGGLSNAIRNAVGKYAAENNLSFYDFRNKTGFLRTLMLRSTSTGQTMVVLMVFEWLEKELFALLDFLKSSFPEITSLQYTHNSKGNDTLAGLDLITYYGRDYIEEEMEGLKFKISARSFYQTNSAQAYELYKIAREFAQLSGHETVYDLYTGTGTIANFVARQAKKVVGVEYVEDAIEDARTNSRNNGIENTVFYAGDLKDVLSAEFIQQNGQPDVVITDPPRAGMHEDVVKVLLAAAPARIVYVSCNPATQARDLAMMQEQYVIKKSQAVDMFPQTAHVENVVLLERRGS